MEDTISYECSKLTKYTFSQSVSPTDYRQYNRNYDYQPVTTLEQNETPSSGSSSNGNFTVVIDCNVVIWSSLSYWSCRHYYWHIFVSTDGAAGKISIKTQFLNINSCDTPSISPLTTTLYTRTQPTHSTSLTSVKRTDERTNEQSLLNVTSFRLLEFGYSMQKSFLTR